MRVHELAKKHNLSSKELLETLKKLKIDAKTHMSALDEEAVDRVEKLLVSPAPKRQAPAPPQTPTKSSPKVTTPPPVPKEGVSTKPRVEKVTTAPAPKPQPSVMRPVEVVAEKKTPQAPAVVVEEAPPRRTIALRFPITVGDLATKLGLRVPELIKALIQIGVMANVNQLLDKSAVVKIGELFGVQIESEPTEEEILVREHQQPDRPQDLVLRPPVVTLMGHVDHGKTSLLDVIRCTNVVDREAGRITQHIGAYEVEIPGKGAVTFLDTPGHAAFTAMRARGANITDVVVLVVAADDGVMPQTIEAIDHARAANLSIVVAINKMDLPQANPERVKRALQKLDLVPEEWGGKTIFVSVSAKTKQGIGELLEMLLLESELLELKANPHCSAEGTVIEAKVSKGQGTVATVLVQRGTLRVGDAVVCGTCYGKVRAMHNDRGKTLKEAFLSCPAEILGLEGVPEAGDRFYVVEDERKARRIAEERQQIAREKALKGQRSRHLKLEDLFIKIKEDKIKELKLIIKADVQGSVEALTQSLEKLSSEKIALRVIHGGVGGINDSDIMLAAASDAVVIGFHVKVDPGTQKLIEREDVDVRLYSIIYEAIEDVRSAMEGMLEPTIKEHVVGNARVLQVFKTSKAGMVAGCRITNGTIARNHKIRLIRNNIVLFDGRLSSLKRFKEDVREVAEGLECGLALEGCQDIQVGDVIEAYKQEKIATKL